MGKDELAEMIAMIAHDGQTDKGGNPYIEHPRFVASKMDTENEKAVAWLHDVVEDTEVELSDLKKPDFDDAVIEAVDAITRRFGEHRKDYLKRVSENAIATKVKIADLEHNLDISRIPNPTVADRERVKRYKREIEWLKGVTQNG